MTTPIAFVFPGQGSQSTGMLGELSAAHPQVREAFAEASEGAGVDLWALSQQGPEEQLNRTEFTQPALLAAGVAAWRAWQGAKGPMPSVLAGHSLANTARWSRPAPCRCTMARSWCACAAADAGCRAAGRRAMAAVLGAATNCRSRLVAMRPATKWWCPRTTTRPARW